MQREGHGGTLPSLSRMARWMRLFWIFPVLLLAFISNMYSQTNSGALAGHILDSSKATIPNTRITATNTETGVASTALSTADGDYLFPDLVPGIYSAKAEAAGFQTEVETHVIILVSRTTSLDFTLQVGSSTQQVTVQATTVGVETQTSLIATTVTNQLVEELPLTNTTAQGGERLVIDLQFLTPSAQGSSYLGKMIGGQESGGDILLDGNSMNSEGGGTNDVENEAPSVEGVREFTVITTGMSAEYGRTTSGILNMATKGGTNNYHGLAYDIIRQTDLDANTWFNNLDAGEVCINANDTPACKKGYATPVDKKNDFGINLGGPVRIPKVYNGKDKTFFFYNWEETKFAKGGTNISTLPTAANRQGDFSANLGTTVLVASNPCDNGAPIHSGQIYNPATTQTINGVTCRASYPGNIINTPLSAVAQKIMSYVPEPNVSNVNTLASNYDRTYDNPVTGTFENIRIDHVFTEKDKIFGSYNTNAFWGPNGSFAIGGPADESTHQNFITHDINVGYDHIFSPRIENRLNLGYWRFHNVLYSNAYLANTDWNQVLGISNLDSPIFPIINFAQGGYYALGVNNGVLSAQNRVAINDHLTWVKGKHTLKFGYDLRDQQYTNYALNSSGTFTFGNAETSGISTSVTQDGNSFASFMLGQIASVNAAVIVAFPRWNTHYQALYAQDDFKVSRTLVLNLGLRWDVDSVPTEAYGNSSMFDPNLPNPGAGGRLGALAFAGPLGGLGLSDQWVGTWHKDFAPRLGFAWAPARFHDKTSIRGSLDIVYGAFPTGLTGGGDQAGFTATTGYTDTNSIGAFSGASFTLDHAYPAFPLTVNTSPSQLNGTTIYYTDQGTRPPMEQMWNLSVEQQLAPDLVLTVNYVGNHDTHLSSDLRDINALPPQYWSMGSELTKQVVGNTYGVAIPYAGFKGTIANALRPYPQYLHITPAVEDTGMSIYEAIWAQLQRHYRNGLTLLTSYAYGYNTTNADWWGPSSYPTYIQDPFDRANDRHISPVDVRNKLTFAYFYQLPFGTGKYFLGSSSRALNQLVGGWTIGGIQTYTGGTPITFGCANTIPGTDNCVRWNHVGNNLTSALSHTKAFNPAVDNFFLNPGQTYSQVFIDPENGVTSGGPYQIGALSRYTTARGVFAPVENFSAVKQIFFTERVRGELRIEMLNAFNRHYWTTPTATPTSLTFGQVTRANTPRQMQAGFRLRF
ncbi:MAG: carboxypeptidase-like regulatory domain-containing protein [Terriglobia bacterium]